MFQKCLGFKIHQAACKMKKLSVKITELSLLKANQKLNETESEDVRRHDQEVVGSHPTECMAFLSSLSLPSTSHLCPYLILLQKICLAVQLGAKQDC